MRILILMPNFLDFSNLVISFKGMSPKERKSNKNPSILIIPISQIIKANSYLDFHIFSILGFHHEEKTIL